MIDKQLSVEHSIDINVTAGELWHALTNPEIIKLYLYGTQTETTWAVGSPIVFKGEYEGKSYKDKGVILENIKNEKLVYSYFSSFSGAEDKAENYHTITYNLAPLPNNGVRFTWQQIGFTSKEHQQHSNNSMPDFLKQIKAVVEKI